MTRDQLVYTTDPAEFVKTLRGAGWSDKKIIFELITGAPHSERRAIAKKYAPLLDLTPAQMLARALGKEDDESE